MVVKNKKGYLKTLEAIIAVMILLSFLLAILPREEAKEAEVPDDIRLTQESIMNIIQSNEELRDCVLSGNNGCITGYIDNNDLVPYTMNYRTLITLTDEIIEPEDLPDKAVYTSNIVISSTDGSTVTSRLFTLFIWRNI